MPLFVKNIMIPVEEDSAPGALLLAVAKKLEIPREDIQSVRIAKRSLDARKKSRIVYHYQAYVESENDEILAKNYADCELKDNPAVSEPLEGIARRSRLDKPPIIIGSGPAGIFAALLLAEAGQPPIIIERGEPVEQRLRTVNELRRDGTFDPESNYCYGEGGAGTFSDGKLTCGRNHPLIKYIFQQWVKFGAPDDILYEAHPHIGTDYLLIVAKKMRAHLENLGTKFIFKTSMTGFEYEPSTTRYSVKLSSGDTLETNHLILAVGHSARETYEMLLNRGVHMEPKPFALGVRIEHPQDEINQIQYGNCQLLGAAEYKLASQVKDRGIWTFCMCPGGHLLPTGAQAGHLSINGMSYHARQSGFANAAVVVNIRREDFYKDYVLDGVRFQQNLERQAFEQAGSNYFSPAQKLGDFLKGKETKSEMKSTYKPGVQSVRIDKLLPPFVVESLQFALQDYNNRMRGFVSDNAIVAGVESKTSAPIIMTRNKNFESISHPGLFPAGEGAGYAGGIVSASLDGLRVAQGLLQSL